MTVTRRLSIIFVGRRRNELAARAIWAQKACAVDRRAACDAESALTVAHGAHGAAIMS